MGIAHANVVEYASLFGSVLCFAPSFLAIEVTPEKDDLCVFPSLGIALLPRLEPCINFAAHQALKCFQHRPPPYCLTLSNHQFIR